MRSALSLTVGRAARLALLGLAMALLSCAQAPTVLAFRVLADDLVPAWCDTPAYRDDPRCPASSPWVHAAHSSRSGPGRSGQDRLMEPRPE